MVDTALVGLFFFFFSFHSLALIFRRFIQELFWGFILHITDTKSKADSDSRGNPQRLRRSLVGILALVRTTLWQREAEEGSKVPLDHIFNRRIGSEIFQGPPMPGLQPDSRLCILPQTERVRAVLFEQEIGRCNFYFYFYFIFNFTFIAL